MRLNSKRISRSILKVDVADSILRVASGYSVALSACVWDSGSVKQIVNATSDTWVSWGGLTVNVQTKLDGLDSLASIDSCRCDCVLPLGPVGCDTGLIGVAI